MLGNPFTTANQTAFHQEVICLLQKQHTAHHIRGPHVSQQVNRLLSVTTEKDKVTRRHSLSKYSNADDFPPPQVCFANTTKSPQQDGSRANDTETITNQHSSSPNPAHCVSSAAVSQPRALNVCHTPYLCHMSVVLSWPVAVELSNCTTQLDSHWPVHYIGNDMHLAQDS